MKDKVGIPFLAPIGPDKCPWVPVGADFVVPGWQPSAVIGTSLLERRQLSAVALSGLCGCAGEVAWHRRDAAEEGGGVGLGVPECDSVTSRILPRDFAKQSVTEP